MSAILQNIHHIRILSQCSIKKLNKGNRRLFEVFKKPLKNGKIDENANHNHLINGQSMTLRKLIINGIFTYY